MHRFRQGTGSLVAILAVINGGHALRTRRCRFWHNTAVLLISVLGWGLAGFPGRAVVEVLLLPAGYKIVSTIGLDDLVEMVERGFGISSKNFKK